MSRAPWMVKTGASWNDSSQTTRHLCSDVAELHKKARYEGDHLKVLFVERIGKETSWIYTKHSAFEKFALPGWIKKALVFQLPSSSRVRTKNRADRGCVDVALKCNVELAKVFKKYGGIEQQPPPRRSSVGAEAISSLDNTWAGQTLESTELTVSIETKKKCVLVDDLLYSQRSIIPTGFRSICMRSTLDLQMRQPLPAKLCSWQCSRSQSGTLFCSIDGGCVCERAHEPWQLSRGHTQCP